MSPATRERIVVWLLRFGGGVMLLAFAAVFLPPAWMDAGHRLLGLGPLPEAPIVDYLARSASALYGIHGGLLLVVATDLRRYLTPVRYLAAMDVVFGAVMIGVDAFAGMPLFWTLSEGPPVIGMGVAILLLCRGLDGPGGG